MKANIIDSLKLLIIDIGKVMIDPRNARKHPDANLEAIKHSLQAYGQRKPIVVNSETNYIEAGNGLWLAAKELGWKKIAAVMVKDDSAMATGYAIMDNQSALLAEWDFPVLKDLLEQLDTGSFNMDLTGFDSKAIEDLMTQFHEPEQGLTDDDEVPDAPEPICKMGDLWQLGEHRLLCGDATKREDVERLMAGEKADMVFTDPPYGISLKPVKNYASKKENKKKEEYQPIVGDDGSFDFGLVYPLIQVDVWYVWGADYLFAKIPNFNSGSLIVWAKRFTEDESDKVFGSAFEICWRLPRKKKVIWFERAINQSSEAMGIHPTQKPTALAIRGIQESSKMKAIVLDPFGGSGSTLIACEKLGRRCFMMEISEMYCSVILKRWENFTDKKAVKIE